MSVAAMQMAEKKVCSTRMAMGGPILHLLAGDHANENSEDHTLHMSFSTSHDHTEYALQISNRGEAGFNIV